MAKELKKKSTRKSKRNPNGAGRKWFDGKDEATVIAKLKETASLDASVEESCYYAEISTDSYYRYLKEHEELRGELSRLREKPVLLARQTAVSKLKESYVNAMDYLSRKRKAEFSTRADTDVNVKLVVNFDETFSEKKKDKE